MFSIMTIASSTTKPVEIVQRHQRQVVEAEKPRMVHERETCQRGESGTADAWE